MLPAPRTLILSGGRWPVQNRDADREKERAGKRLPARSFGSVRLADGYMLR